MDGLSFSLEQLKSKNSNFNFRVELGLQSDGASISPQLIYALTPKIQISLVSQLDTELKLSTTASMQYQISDTHIAAIIFRTSHNQLTRLNDTALIANFAYHGFMLKFPIFTCDQGSNGWGLAMTAGIFGALNGYAFWKLKRKEKKKPLHETPEFKIAYGNF